MMNTRDFYHRLTRFRQVLIVLAQPSVTPQPGECPFHNPTAPQRDEPPLARRTAYHHHPVTPLMPLQPIVELRAVVSAVRLNHFQPWVVLARHLGEQVFRR